MMTMNKSSRWNTLRALAVVPVIALALLAFANTKSVAAVVVNQQSKVTPTSQVVKANAEAQVTDESAPQSKKVYRSVDQMPQFPGGEAGLMRYLQSNINYPANAAMNNIGGRVILQFVVEKDGHIGEVKVVRSIDPEIDAEAVRVVKSLPDFIPGRQDGEPVAVWYTIPVSFKVQSEPAKPEGE